MNKESALHLKSRRVQTLLCFGLAFTLAVPVLAAETCTTRQIQTVVNGGVVVPRSIPPLGMRQLLKKGTLTNAGNPVQVQVEVLGPGYPHQILPYRLIRTPDGEVFLRTFGYKLTLRITWSAPETADYFAYQMSRTYQTN